MTYLSDGKYASPPDELTALVLEAHRQGVSCGQLVANTSQRELDEIIRAYCEDGPEVYRKIENILAALPGDMGQKARWAAEKMVAEVFAEYLVARLGLEEGEGHAVQ